MSFKVSLSGPAGSGKSSVIDEIVKRYGCDTADVGQIFRKRAVEKGMTIAEYDAYIEANPQEDICMDEDFKERINACEKGIVVSWRMGFHFVPEIISILLTVDPHEAARRVFEADRGKQETKYATIEDAKKANADRIERARKRLLDLYGVDFLDEANHHAVIDTTGLTIVEVAEKVMALLDTRLQTPQKSAQ